MESPVLLQTSQVTVDETTLVYLLLQKSPRCPFTRTTLDQHSFCRLPELQQEIHAWRTNVSTTTTLSHAGTPINTTTTLNHIGVYITKYVTLEHQSTPLEAVN
ncbi:hypothetical protein Pcinc_004316 [Petrolisthes cinctipes]|uniref:U-box domain-containing protein n=1 Tax=Petrolisthes cinctipes TaxID=88211 RepID=A0AAE1L0A5_PETCI|nr:hypothetical protein Pcinc_004316 [Petrolisthes cinctipes]